ncbi:MAG: hypothetical protein FWB78_02305 [Treponema sp.]|nr:hypothetical protein [Treponema sp.]
MKRRIFPRIAWALFLSLMSFVLLSAMQFARYGTFSRQVGGMTISGRYFNGEAAYAGSSRPGWIRLDGGANLFFGGLEFRLVYAPGVAGGFSLVDSENTVHQVLPEYLAMTGNEAIFSLPSGVELSFYTFTQEEMPELRISGTFPEGIDAIEIPFRPRRASVAWDNARGILGVAYDGLRYRFSRHSQELTEGRLVLLASTPTVFYRVIPDLIVNNPADFVIPRVASAQAFSREIAAWTDRNFDAWGRNMPANVDEDRVIAFCAEALRRGVYATSAPAIPLAFGQSQNRTWESSVFQFDGRAGAWRHGVEALAAQGKAGLVGELLARRDYGSLFAKNHLIEYLMVRGHGTLVDSFVSSAFSIEPSAITLGMSAGVLESYMVMGAGVNNPFEPLAVRARQLIADGLRQNGDQVLVFSPDGQADVELNLRLGMALREWGEQTGNEDWAGLGRSLVFSVISLEDPAPAVLTSGANGNLTGSVERIGSGSMFRMMGKNEFLPRARTTGVDGVWAWTAARSVRAVQTANFMDFYVDFPVGESHYVMLQGVRPFVQLQLHGQNTVRNPAFETSANISGWDYFADEQTLVVKLHHRTAVERVRVLFTVPPPTPVAAPTPIPTPVPTPAPVVIPVVPVQEAEDPSPLPPPPVRARPPTWTPPPVVPPMFFPQP